jgi:hypothetical protein
MRENGGSLYLELFGIRLKADGYEYKETLADLPG